MAVGEGRDLEARLKSKSSKVKPAKESRPKAKKDVEGNRVPISRAGDSVFGDFPEHDGLAAKKAARKMVPMTDRFRLLDANNGLYLHFSGKGFIKAKELAWWGVHAQVQAIKKANPDLKNLIPEQVERPIAKSRR